MKATPRHLLNLACKKGRFPFVHKKADPSEPACSICNLQFTVYNVCGAPNDPSATLRVELVFRLVLHKHKNKNRFLRTGFVQSKIFNLQCLWCPQRDSNSCSKSQFRPRTILVSGCEIADPAVVERDLKCLHQSEPSWSTKKADPSEPALFNLQSTMFGAPNDLSILRQAQDRLRSGSNSCSDSGDTNTKADSFEPASFNLQSSIFNLQCLVPPTRFELVFQA